MGLVMKEKSGKIPCSFHHVKTQGGAGRLQTQRDPSLQPNHADTLTLNSSLQNTGK